MLSTQQTLNGITHPLISSIFLKKDFSDPSKYHEDVLVIETNFNHNDAEHDEAFDSYLIELLSDLNDLKVQAEEKIGKFDRVDIRTH